MMTDDIEDLKVHKIAPPSGDRRHLPIAGSPARVADRVEEATYGSGEAPAGPVDRQALREKIVGALKGIYDPEIPVNVYDLGLIYGFDIDEQAQVEIQMTLTAPACPVAGVLVNQVAETVGRLPEVSKAHVTLVWEPPWSKDRMTEAALVELGLL